MASQCIHCGKIYTRKSSLKNHTLLCELLKQTKREKKIDNEESSELPSYRDLVTIVGMLAVANQKLEEKVNTLEKWANKSKKKIDIVDWLNSNVTPSSLWCELLEPIILDEEYINHILDNNPLKTYQLIFETWFSNTSGSFPFCAFSQKSNTFYIYEKTITNEQGVIPNPNNNPNPNPSWRELSKEELISFLYKIDRKLQHEVTKWRKKYAEKNPARTAGR